MKEPVGIAVLTNADRRGYLEQNLKAFIDNTSYRPLIFGIFDNGSTDSTPEFCKNLPVIEGVEWRYQRSEVDLGCGPGVNRANNLVNECEFTIFLEADWTCLHESESGCAPTWLDECLDFIKTGKADYIYLRRFRNDNEIRFHQFDYVLANSKHTDGKFLYTERFMYSNNPHVRRTKALFENGTLPLKEFYDANGKAMEKKDNKVWGQAEHLAKHPKNFWIHTWGMFAHETTPTPPNLKTVGCNKYGPHGLSTCKYGLLEFRNGFCPLCDFSKDFHDLQAHNQRFGHYYQTMLNMRHTIKPCVGSMEFNPGLSRVDGDFNSGLSKVNHLEVKKVN